VKYPHFLVLLLSFLSISYAHAWQKELLFDNLTQKEGLPSNETYYVFRDSKNYLWFATDKGVTRYNGSKMEYFNLPDNVIFQIREDHKGRIWFFSHTGKLSYFLNGKIYVYPYNKKIKDSIPAPLITAAYITQDETIRINSANYENYTISKDGSIKTVWYRLPKQTGGAVMKIDEIEPGKLWAQKIQSPPVTYTSLTIHLTTRQGKRSYHIPFYTDKLAICYGATLSQKGDVFVFLGNYLFRLNQDGTYLVREMPATVLCLQLFNNNRLMAGMISHGMMILSDSLENQSPVFLKGKSVTSLSIDNENGYWLTTLENGAYYIKNPHLMRLSGFPEPFETAWRLYNMNDSALLFATSNGFYSSENGKVKSLLRQRSREICHLFVNDKNIYIGRIGFSQNNSIFSVNRAIRFFEKTVFISNARWLLDMGHGKFMVQNGPHLFVLNTLTGSDKVLSSNFHTCRIGYKDADNTIWLGTMDGLYQYDERSNSTHRVLDTSSVISQGITGIEQMPNGWYLLNVRFGGITLMKDSSIITQITTEDGLLSNAITSLLVINNQVWAATSNGISVITFSSYTPLQYKIQNIGENEHFFNLNVHQLIQFKNSIYAATSRGIYIIEKPAELLNKAKPPLPLYIHSVHYYKGDTTAIDRLTVPYHNRRVVIRISAISFNAHKEIKYYYRISRADSSWQTLNTDELLLEQLPPGQWDIEIKAIIPGQQRVSEIQRFSLQIEKPWWQNNLLILLVIVSFASALFLIIKARVSAIRKKEEQKVALHQKMAQLEQTSLRSQMNPHFIFNALTSIQQLIISGNTTEANDYLVRFSRLIRKTLDLSSDSYISIAEEKEYLAEYVQLEQLRFPRKFSYEILIDESIDQQKTQIPNMLLQPIVENCIRHGFKQLNGQEGKITVMIRKSGRFIQCIVRDNGVGRTVDQTGNFTSHKSYGIDLIRQRLENISILNNEHEYSFEIKDLAPNNNQRGTEVVLNLPYKKNTHDKGGYN
jgi:two-component sensor histidine kinase